MFEESSLAELEAGVESVNKRLGSHWMKFCIKYDPRPVLAKVECPVRLIIGSKNLRGLTELNMTEIRKALESVGNKGFELVTLQGQARAALAR